MDLYLYVELRKDRVNPRRKEEESLGLPLEDGHNKKDGH